MKKTNCLFYAFGLWLRHGGYLLMRRSHFGPFPHFIWMAELPSFWPARQWVPDAPEHCCCPPVDFYRNCQDAAGGGARSGLSVGVAVILDGVLHAGFDGPRSFVIPVF